MGGVEPDQVIGSSTSENEEGEAVESFWFCVSELTNGTRLFDRGIEGVFGSFFWAGVDGDRFALGVGVESWRNLVALPDGDRDVANGLEVGIFVSPAGLEELVVGFAEVTFAEGVALREGIEGDEEGEIVLFGFGDEVFERVEPCGH